MIFTKPFSGVKAKDVYPTDFQVGELCPEELEDAAMSLDVVEDGDPVPKKKPKPKKDAEQS